MSRIGRGEVGAHTDPINSAEMFLLLEPRDRWGNAGSQNELREFVRAELGDIPGVLTNFTQPIAMTVDELLEGVRAELAVKLFGDDLDVLKRKADEIAQVVGGVTGAADVQVDQISGTPQLLIGVDRQAIARYGINVADVQKVVQAAVGGELVGQVFEGTRRFDILVRFAPRFRSSPEAIAQILVQSPMGLQIPLAQLARIEEVVGPRQITREKSQRFITVQCNVSGRDMGSFVEEAQEAIAGQVALPPGYLVTWGGQFRLQQEANRRLSIVVPITLFALFLLLFSSFNSLKNAVLILLNIPLALVGRGSCPVADRAEPLGAVLGGFHRPVRHRPGEQHGDGDLLQPARPRRGGPGRSLGPGGVPAGEAGADDRPDHRPGADPPAVLQRHRQRGATSSGDGSRRRPGQAPPC